MTGPPTCARTGCTNHAELYPVLLVYPPAGDRPAQIILRLPCCAFHAAPDPRLFVDGPGWAKIEQMFRAAGKLQPARNRTQVTFIPIADGDAVMAQARTIALPDPPPPTRPTGGPA